MLLFSICVLIIIDVVLSHSKKYSIIFLSECVGSDSEVEERSATVF